MKKAQEYFVVKGHVCFANNKDEKIPSAVVVEVLMNECPHLDDIHGTELLDHCVCKCYNATESEIITFGVCPHLEKTEYDIDTGIVTITCRKYFEAEEFGVEILEKQIYCQDCPSIEDDGACIREMGIFDQKKCESLEEIFFDDKSGLRIKCNHRKNVDNLFEQQGRRLNGNKK